jgi:DNA polymerase-3 subunit gamma/tau
MAYRALYRQYRPARFSDVIGQEHITTTLKHQVEADRPAHAYLFCGTRGTGKTSTARILARAVNCLSPEQGEPCGKCEACMLGSGEGAADITEIDAASNNSVSDVRDLIDSAQYAPLRLRRRVFIIDEVHMLSGAAFNALLKTLEEPPEHIIFILATTEPQKLPATIISRCQRFDFHRLSVPDIKQTLTDVLSRAGASIEDEGKLLIARAAQGGMRDALSLADQCLAFCGDQVTTQDVYNVLGSMEDAFLFDMADALLRSDTPGALRMLDGIVHSGRDLSVFCADLASHFRSLLLAKTCGRCEELLDCTPDVMTRCLEQAKPVSEARLMLALDRLLAAQNDMRYLPSPRTMLESAMVHICRPEDSLSLAALEARVDRIETKLETGVPAANPATVPAPKAPQSTPAPATPAEKEPAPKKERTPVKKTGPKPKDAEPEQAETPSAAPNPAVSPNSPAPSGSAAVPAQNPPGGAAALWRETIAAIPNMFVQAIAREGFAVRLENDTLTVGFTEAQEVKYKSISAPVNFEPVQRALQSVRPEIKLAFTLTKAAPASDQATAIAKELFGDKLSIE